MSALFAPLLAAFALALALAFRRHRAAQLLAVFGLGSLGVDAAALLPPNYAARGADALVMFGPWLVLLAAAMPEPPLRSRRMLAFLLALGFALWLTAFAPAHVWAGLVDALPLTPGSARPGRVACLFALAASAIGLLRWSLRGMPLDLGLALSLAALAAMYVGLGGIASSTWLLVAIVLATLAVVHASYRMALLDALTGLPNRRALDETLARVSGTYALAMVDVDHFKQFNDTHGHDAGDNVLVAVARSLGRTRGATAYRFGGEEFCLLFRKPDMAEAACEEARARIEALAVRLPRKPPPATGKKNKRKEDRGPKTVAVTVSIGLAERDAARRLSHEVLKSADQALYKAKSRGRNQVVA